MKEAYTPTEVRIDPPLKGEQQFSLCQSCSTPNKLNAYSVQKQTTFEIRLCNICPRAEAGHFGRSIYHFLMFLTLFKPFLSYIFK
jgi:protein-arginine kinase activator protein McsA